VSVDPIDAAWLERLREQARDAQLGHLREQARDAQRWAATVSRWARCLEGAPLPIIEVQVDAHRAGIIAREARRQYQAALDAAALTSSGGRHE
jgi:hypothetical protein